MLRDNWLFCSLQIDENDAALKNAAAELSTLLDELKITEKELDQAGNPDADRFTVTIRLEAFVSLSTRVWHISLHSQPSAAHSLTTISAY